MCAGRKVVIRVFPRISEDKVLEMAVRAVKEVRDDDLRKIGEAVIRVCEKDGEACMKIYRVAIFVVKVVEGVIGRGGEEEEQEE